MPPLPEEPVLDLDNIQGNIVDAFNKERLSLLYLRIEHAARFKGWLAGFVDRVASARQVRDHNDRFRAARQAGTAPPRRTWIHVAFSFAGLDKLTPRAADFRDEAFRQGLRQRSSLLGDPVDPTIRGHPSGWLVGGAGGEPDVLIMVASDEAGQPGRLVGELEADFPPLGRAGAAPNGAKRLRHRDDGARLEGGREHFGFKDGGSQPALRGRASADSADFLTASRDGRRVEARPGQRLLWPGEFIFGYPRQHPDDPDPPGETSSAGTPWARDGSFLVFRRLNQDVARFRAFVDNPPAAFAWDPEQVAARCVGRWPSGAPTIRALRADDPALADDAERDNFAFGGDPDGWACPLGAHIRKVYPRDDRSGTFSVERARAAVETHRLLRRGITFGPAPPAATDDRGVLFLAYQTSCVRQFEFVTTDWVNNDNFRRVGAGLDILIGQSRAERPVRRFRVTGHRPDGHQESWPVRRTDHWVYPTGGGYFFSPSRSALRDLAGNPA